MVTLHTVSAYMYVNVYSGFHSRGDKHLVPKFKEAGENTNPRGGGGGGEEASTPISNVGKAPCPPPP